MQYQQWLVTQVRSCSTAKMAEMRIRMEPISTNPPEELTPEEKAERDALIAAQAQVLADRAAAYVPSTKSSFPQWAIIVICTVGIAAVAVGAYFLAR